MNDLENLQAMFSGFSLNIGYITYALLALIVTDFATGIVKAYKAHGLNSSKLRDGGFKKAGIILVVVLGYGLSLLFTDSNFIIFHSIEAYYIYTELVSVIENLGELGVNMPAWLVKITGGKRDDAD